MAKTILNFPIETPEAQKFWASPHISNQAKSVIAFSLNEKNALDNLRRYGYKLLWRQRAWKAWGQYVNNPSMAGVPFSTDVWWKEFDGGVTPPDPEPPKPIDFLSATLDSRVKFSCASTHLFVKEDGTFGEAASNTWPLSYKDGKVAGRHEPEPSRKNYQPDPRITETGSPGAEKPYMLAGGTGVQLPTAAPDGKSAFFIDNAAWNKYGVFNATTSTWIVPESAIPSLSTTWKRLVAKYKTTAVARIRTYMMRAGSQNYIYGLSEDKIPAGDTISSVYHKQNNNGIEAAIVQVESGAFSTSPILTGTRGEMKVTVSTEKAKSATIKYSDGTSKEVTFTDGQTEFEIPQSTSDWGTRYITGIEYKV
ncbi:hypothetical protein TacPo2_68 [Pantoea bacteriophage TacPo2]